MPTKITRFPEFRRTFCHGWKNNWFINFSLKIANCDICWMKSSSISYQFIFIWMKSQILNHGSVAWHESEAILLIRFKVCVNQWLIRELNSWLNSDATWRKNHITLFQKEWIWKERNQRQDQRLSLDVTFILLFYCLD